MPARERSVDVRRACVLAGAEPIPMQMDRGEAGASTEAGAEAGGSSAKRPRTTPEPFLTAAAGGASQSEGSSATIDPALAGLIVTMQALTTQVKTLHTTLPALVAAAVPAAVRAHDEEEAQRSRKLAVESALGSSILSDIDAASNMVQLGKIDGWRYNQHENTLSCIECEAYAHMTGIRKYSFWRLEL